MGPSQSHPPAPLANSTLLATRHRSNTQPYPAAGAATRCIGEDREEEKERKRGRNVNGRALKFHDDSHLAPGWLPSKVRQHIDSSSSSSSSSSSNSKHQVIASAREQRKHKCQP
ncbi:uncharacterized protein PG986_008600 [Apiospora aurea]|uniref:Uncharacterized protein n=1 Tax=Apiospora aurea TaxID=335848 RepID=A0ABR1Q5S0_9PEZI